MSHLSKFKKVSSNLSKFWKVFMERPCPSFYMIW